MRFENIIPFFTRPPTSGPKSTLVIRLMAGGVFLSEGLLKFAFANQGIGRFTKLGMPMPGLLAPAIALLEMVVAILSTKISLFFGTSPLPKPPAPPFTGWWAVLHESRSDYAQLLCCVFLLVSGPGPWSLDAVLQRWRGTRQASVPRPSSPVSTVAPA